DPTYLSYISPKIKSADFAALVSPSCTAICRLAFGTTFQLNRSVLPAEDEVTSATGFRPAGAGEPAGAAFTTTHWSVVLEAQGESPAAQDALETLCRTYWRPIYSFVRRQGAGTEDAEDLNSDYSTPSCGGRRMPFEKVVRAFELEPESQDAFHGAIGAANLALVSALVGEPDQAITLIERLLSTPGAASYPDWPNSITLAELRLRR